MQYANMFKMLAPESLKTSVINELKSAVKHYKERKTVLLSWSTGFFDYYQLFYLRHFIATHKEA